MKPGRWQQVKEIYQAALDSAPSLRKDLLDKACAGDEELRRDVESLLAQQPDAKEFLESPALELAAKALARDQTRVVARWEGNCLRNRNFCWS